MKNCKKNLLVASLVSTLFISMANTTFEIVWVTHLLWELHILPPSRPTFLCDNRSAVFLSQNPVSHNRSTPFNDPTTYHSLVGTLQYLTITHPDLYYDVNQVSQFFHDPTIDHFQAIKRILRYVKGTISYGLSFWHSTKPSILGYSDVD